MVKPLSFALAALGFILMSDFSSAGFSFTALTSFGGGDGWIGPGERSYLTTGDNQRGLAYNPVTGHLLVVNRSGGLSINIINSSTGADAGTVNSSSIVGSPAEILHLAMIAAGDDGAI